MNFCIGEQQPHLDPLAAAQIQSILPPLYLDLL